MDDRIFFYQYQPVHVLIAVPVRTTHPNARKCEMQMQTYEHKVIITKSQFHFHSYSLTIEVTKGLSKPCRSLLDLYLELRGGVLKGPSLMQR